MARTARASAALLALMIGVAACSSDGDDSSTSTPDSSVGGDVSVPDVADDALPIIDQIPVAIAALEAETGGPAEFFEVNATAQLVNLFVALNDGAVAQPWLYVGGTLTASEGQAANGGTFAGADVEFDPEVVLSQVLTEVPGIRIESFYIHGDGEGNVLYGVLATSERGGGLDIVLGADGTVKSVDPVG
ncbi:MAG: hypothetical protein Q8M22_00225 [Actinomycetota bacterium]|nr:hypothetical protein [Actinomycetota bacterium]